MTLPKLPAPRRAPTKKPPPFFDVEWDTPDAAALQALARGDATPEQQKRALDWTINKAARAYDVSFQPDNPHGTDFFEGRRYVGLKIVELLKISTRDFATQDRGER